MIQTIAMIAALAGLPVGGTEAASIYAGTQAVDRVYAGSALVWQRAVAPEPGPEYITNGIILWYKLDEGTGTNITDSSGRGKHGYGTAITWTNNGVVFNGTSALIDIPAPAVYTATAGTYAAWIYPTKADNYRIIYTWPSPAGAEFYIHNGGGYEFNVNGRSTAQKIPGPPMNEWTHVAFSVATNGVWNIYTNGLLAFSGTDSLMHWSATGGGTLRLGARVSGTRYYYGGRMRDVRWYDRALSSNEIYTIKGELEP